MSIETDESLWPEGAQWYGKRVVGWLPGFYKLDDGRWYYKRLDEGDWNTVGHQDPHEYRDLTPRPTAPWPQVGVECEYGPNSDGKFATCKILGKCDEYWWIREEDMFITLHADTVTFRKSSTLRDDLIKLLDGYDWLADAVLEKYELKEKTK